MEETSLDMTMAVDPDSHHPAPPSLNSMDAPTSVDALYAPHFTAAELETAIRLLTLYVDDPDLKVQAGKLPRIRHLFTLARQLIDMSPEELKSRRKKRAKEKLDQDHQTLQSTGIRELRKVKMVGMSGGSVPLALPPLVGSIEANQVFMIEDEKKAAEALKAEPIPSVTSTTPLLLRGPETEPVTTTPLTSSASDLPPSPPLRTLNYKRSCHICTDSFDKLHPFYDQLCPKCAEFNYAKRSSNANMTGRVCIVTGARIKIGYAIAVKLLQMGAIVIATTRFPHDAARRFAAESGADLFRDRLHVYGLDFRDMQMLHHFTAHVRLTFGRLDVLINNAAQTVRKPPAFYEHLLEHESKPLPREVEDVVRVVDVYRAEGGRYVFGKSAVGTIAASSDENTEKLHVVEEIHPAGPEGGEEEIVLSTLSPAELFATSGTLVSTSATTALNAQQSNSKFVPNPLLAASSAELSQVPVLADDRLDKAEAKALFPPGLYDRDDQQVDLRTTNSWKLELGQISTLEMVECHVINSFAPWVLVSELKGLMAATGEPGGGGRPEDWDKYVVNVSAMEGQFYRNKTIFHPHTNMAKASLNMMTRTAASGFAACCIYMTAVDTGWITDENPVHMWDKRENQPPPLDEWDAAMRVLDPVIKGVNGEERAWGVFLKNYRPTRW
ncbi:hypothetical protein BC829DRAFT_369032 [Chytridium lagenaria]|nr:hypothetical protein BC829DRAFT_369032 [Chytridium lagenaria]